MTLAPSSRNTKVSRVLVFHAEELHDDHVWRRVERAVRWMARTETKATFFIYPFRAQVAGKDITDRVRLLAALGHEIGQHTHFYAGTKIDRPDKANDFSRANIVHCLHRDFETLKKMGTLPQGFTAGAWVVNEMVLDTLVELNFSYDCSARLPKPKKMATPFDHRWLRLPQFYANAGGRLLCLPTTCNMSEWWLKWARKVQAETPTPYQLIYLHDYDLLSARTYYSTLFFLLSSRNTLCSANQLYQREAG